MSAQLDQIKHLGDPIGASSCDAQTSMALNKTLVKGSFGTPAYRPGQAALEILDEIVLSIGANQYGALEKSFPGLLDKVTRICALKLEKAYDQAAIPMTQRVMDSLKGLGSASPVITAESVYYLPMNSAPMGQKLIALGPGGCGVFEQFSNRNKDDYYGWFPMPKVAEDNPIRVQYRM